MSVSRLYNHLSNSIYTVTSHLSTPMSQPPQHPLKLPTCPPSTGTLILDNIKALHYMQPCLASPLSPPPLGNTNYDVLMSRDLLPGGSHFPPGAPNSLSLSSSNGPTLMLRALMACIA
ncbi:hypothetical protein F5876DRAFT_80244 [Lentinula aff. lateritia]|uniref:Uncharacterized protein n=1 Tax=Lentinula aff. lateritia TaxID=2804960 RepID=A0ACC1TQQ4_9AGAR|nr:hypothetical protein F5876DRAFT_80244 [Lentinula aff. lateritia]